MKRVLILFAVLAVAQPAIAAPQADLWPRWQAHDEASTITVDHGAWDRWLKTYVTRGEDGINRIPYGRVSEADKRVLAAYIESLSTVLVRRLRRDEQRALWINLYNALTVKVVLDHYPVESIRNINISPGFFSSGPWGKKLVKIDGERVSLDDIEHRILRPIWKDPRLHYAVNCASLGCPNLMADAFTADNTESLLDAGAKGYVNHPRGVLRTEGGLRLSSIYDWFIADFGDDKKALLSHLATFANSTLKEVLRSEPSIAGYEYDWAPNDAR